MKPMNATRSYQGETIPLRVGFIGAGKAGTSFGRYIAERAKVCRGIRSAASEVRLSGYFSRRPESAQFAASLTGSRSFPSAVALTEASDIVFLSVPDDLIASIFSDLMERCRANNLTVSGKLFAHLSGSLASSVLAGANTSGAHDGAEIRAFSLHPACSLPDKETAWTRLHDACFIYEGPDDVQTRIAPLLALIEGPVGTVDAKHKTLYHAACVFLSNFPAAIAAEGLALLSACGIERDIAGKFLGTLFLGNTENIAAMGPANALTGPVERGDTGTIAAHMEALVALSDETALSAYKSLTSILLRVAREKHPSRDYSTLDNHLNEIKHTSD